MCCEDGGVHIGLEGFRKLTEVDSEKGICEAEARVKGGLAFHCTAIDFSTQMHVFPTQK